LDLSSIPVPLISRQSSRINKVWHCELAGIWLFCLNFFAFHYHKWRLLFSVDEHYIDYVFIAKE